MELGLLFTTLLVSQCLEKSFYIDQLSEVVQDNVNLFSLNAEQERAFRIIANHAISANLEQIRMYLGGMGGTGKSQVLKALSSFFPKQERGSQVRRRHSNWNSCCVAWRLHVPLHVWYK